MDDADAGPLGVGGAAEADGPAADEQLALVVGDHAARGTSSACSCRRRSRPRPRAVRPARCRAKRRAARPRRGTAWSRGERRSTGRLAMAIHVSPPCRSRSAAQSPRPASRSRSRRTAATMISALDDQLIVGRDPQQVHAVVDGADQEAPSRVPQTPPRPPARLVPPITTEAITSSS